VAITATGFAARERPDHWKRHGYEFPELADEFEYEQLAVAFLTRILIRRKCMSASVGVTVIRLGTSLQQRISLLCARTE
jgi:hypothetical protein